MKPCKHCLSSGNYVDYIGYPQQQITGIETVSPIQVVPCKFCNGKGYINEEEFVTVQRNMLKMNILTINNNEKYGKYVLLL